MAVRHGSSLRVNTSCITVSYHKQVTSFTVEVQATMVFILFIHLTSRLSIDKSCMFDVIDDSFMRVGLVALKIPFTLTAQEFSI